MRALLAVLCLWICTVSVARGDLVQGDKNYIVCGPSEALDVRTECNSFSMVPKSPDLVLTRAGVLRVRDSVVANNVFSAYMDNDEQVYYTTNDGLFNGKGEKLGSSKEEIAHAYGGGVLQSPAGGITIGTTYQIVFDSKTLAPVLRSMCNNQMVDSRYPRQDVRHMYMFDHYFGVEITDSEYRVVAFVDRSCGKAPTILWHNVMPVLWQGKRLHMYSNNRGEHIVVSTETDTYYIYGVTGEMIMPVVNSPRVLFLLRPGEGFRDSAGIDHVPNRSDMLGKQPDIKHGCPPRMYPDLPVQLARCSIRCQDGDTCDMTGTVIATTMAQSRPKTENKAVEIAKNNIVKVDPSPTTSLSPSPSPSSPPSSSDDSGNGLAIGISVSVVLVVIAVAGIWFYRRNKKQRTSGQTYDKINNNNNGRSSSRFAPDIFRH